MPASRSGPVRVNDRFTVSSPRTTSPVSDSGLASNEATACWSFRAMSPWAAAHEAWAAHAWARRSTAPAGSDWDRSTPPTSGEYTESITSERTWSGCSRA